MLYIFNLINYNNKWLSNVIPSQKKPKNTTNITKNGAYNDKMTPVKK